MPGIVATMVQNVRRKVVERSRKVRERPARVVELTNILLEATEKEITTKVAETTARVLVEDFERDVFYQTFSDVLGNLEAFLRKAPALPSRLGLVIEDEESSESANRFARNCFYERMRDDTKSALSRALLECLSLVPSHHSVGIQIADFCMGAIGARVRRGETKYADIIEANINKERSTSRLLGLHVLPKS